MVGRILATGIVAFWLVMTGALVRVEFFPEPLGVSEVPPELVLRKIFNSDESARLNVFYHGTPMGFCKVEFTPVYRPGTTTDGSPTNRPASYRVQSELTLTLASSGVPTRMRFVGDSFFNPNFELDSFSLKSTVGDGRVDVRGDSTSKKVNVDIEFGELRDHRVFDFAQMQGTGLAGAMGLPGLANFGQMGGLPSGPGGLGMMKPTTRIYLSDLRLGGVRLRAYLLESKLDESMWTKMWVSERGEILKVATSIGVTMLQDVFSQEMDDSRDSGVYDSH